MSFILDALRKSEHERQRSAVPGLSQVPLATPRQQLPRWALGVMAVLAVALLALGGAWWQSTRSPARLAAESAPTVERNVEIPPPSPRAAQQSAPSRSLSQEPSLATAAGPSSGAAEAVAPAPPASAPRQINLPADADALSRPSADALSLPSATALVAQGVALPPLRLELHAYSERPRDRFVFINGRKYAEGDRLVEGPLVESIEPTGVVLSHAGRSFLLVQE